MTFEPDWAIPPGASITRLLSIKEIPPEELADELGMDDEGFERLLSGDQRISEETAETLSLHLGSTPAFWLRRDQIYASELQRLHSSDTNEVDEWVRSLPTRQMSQLGWIQKNLRSKRLHIELLNFFGCESFAEWKAIYSSGLDAVAFRTSSAFEADDLATIVWKRMGELQAAQTELPSFNKEAFQDVLPSLKRLGYIHSPAELVQKLRERLSPTGVALTTARAPSGCRASGATWVSDEGNPIIHLSFRHLSDDHFWFTLYHEAAHIVLNHGEHVAYDVKRPRGFVDIEEKQANELASNLLIPLKVREWIGNFIPNARNVILAARKAKVAPGVVAGQLENSGTIVYGKLSFLKKRYVWKDNPLLPEEK